MHMKRQISMSSSYVSSAPVLVLVSDKLNGKFASKHIPSMDSLNLVDNADPTYCC